jgi:hypothetical protein
MDGRSLRIEKLGAVVALLAFLYLSQPVPAQAPQPSVEEIVQPGDRYDASLPPDAKVAAPGLQTLSFSFSHGELAWCYHLALEGNTWKGKRWSECTLPSGCSRSTSALLCLPLPGFDASLCWQKDERWGGMAKKPPTRHFYQTFTVDGKEVSCLVIETAAEIPLSRSTSVLSLTYGPLKRELLRWQWQEEIKARITLRLCPDCNWYYVRLRVGNREAGPGWREAPSNEANGHTQVRLSWSDQQEQYRIQWRKRIQRGPGGQLAECFIGPPRNLLEKGWDGEGPAPVD